MDKGSEATNNPNPNAFPPGNVGSSSSFNGKPQGIHFSQQQQQHQQQQQQQYQQQQMGGILGNASLTGSTPATVNGMLGASGGAPYSSLGQQLSMAGSGITNTANDANALLAVLSSLIAPSGNPGNHEQPSQHAAASSMQQQQQRHPPPPHLRYGSTSLMPQLAGCNSDGVTPAAQPTHQGNLGLNNQQLLALLLQQQQQQQHQQQPKHEQTWNAVNSNSASTNSNTSAIQALAQAMSGSSNNASAVTGSSGLNLSAILSALSSSRNQHASSTVPTTATTYSEIPSCNNSFAGKRKPSGGGFAERSSEDGREAAISKGAKLLPCRARGMPMDHNIHVSIVTKHLQSDF